MGSKYDEIIEFMGLEIKVIHRNPNESVRDYMKNTRVYVFGLEKFDDLYALEKALPAPKMKGEDKENDKAYATYNRKYAGAVRVVGLKGLGAAFGHVTRRLQLEDVVAKFSSKAGCSCPCSPGLVLDRRLRTHNGPVDIYVTVKDTRGKGIL